MYWPRQCSIAMFQASLRFLSLRLSQCAMSAERRFKITIVRHDRLPFLALVIKCRAQRPLGAHEKGFKTGDRNIEHGRRLGVAEPFLVGEHDRGALTRRQPVDRRGELPVALAQFERRAGIETLLVRAKRSLRATLGESR